mmetsp:Transcript_743/g.2429  ORF Transcript_743/g.2429 Transcript_743/m.2429 type:complete len:149 (+) Transcript_743:67-513(+)
MKFSKILKAKGRHATELIEELRLTKAEAEYVNELAEDFNLGYVNKTLRNIIDYYIMEEDEFNRVMKESKSQPSKDVEVVLTRVTIKHEAWLTDMAKRWAGKDKSEVVRILIQYLMTQPECSFIFDAMCTARESVELYNDLITDIVIDT